MLFATTSILLSTIASVAASGPAFDKIFQIWFENKDYTDVVAHPFFKSLIAQGQLLENFHGVTHPSQPNYIAAISGSTDGVYLDFDSEVTDRKTIVDLLETAGKTWTSYQEDLPSPCFTGSTSGRYARKHNPFISFPSISQNPKRCSRIVNANQLHQDIASNTVADYVFYTPTMDNNGHDTDLAYSMNWLEGFLTPSFLANPVFARTLFVITWDEDHAPDYSFGLADFKNNKIATLLLGSGAKAGSVDQTEYNHYSILATIEQQWNLGYLGLNDATTQPLQSLSYASGSTHPSVTATGTATAISVTSTGSLASSSTSVSVTSATDYYPSEIVFLATSTSAYSVATPGAGGSIASSSTSLGAKGSMAVVFSFFIIESVFLCLIKTY